MDYQAQTAPAKSPKTTNFEIDKTEKPVADAIKNLNKNSAKKSTKSASKKLITRLALEHREGGGAVDINTNQAIEAAKKHFQDINMGANTDFGTFNIGFAITKEMLADLKSVPDFQAILVCLAAYTSEKDTIVNQGEDLKVKSLIFPVFKVITSEGITKDFWCPNVPGYIPPPKAQGTNDIYYCPPLNPCPRKP